MDDLKKKISSLVYGYPSRNINRIVDDIHNLFREREAGQQKALLDAEKAELSAAIKARTAAYALFESCPDSSCASFDCCQADLAVIDAAIRLSNKLNSI